MAIDMAVLKAATYGDQEKKIEVKRKWLSEVHKQLEEGEQAKRELETLKARVKAHNDAIEQDQRADPWGAFDERMDQAFGPGSKIDRMFGRKRKQ